MRRIRSVMMLLGAGLILLHSPPLQAQLGPSLRGAGMAGAYAGLARGHEAAGWNPALLGLADRPGWSVALPAFDLSALMLGPDVLEMYDVLSKGSELDDWDRLDLLDAIPDSGVVFNGAGRMHWVGLSIGGFAVTASTTGVVGGNVGKELVDLALYVRQYGDIDPTRLLEYRVGNTAAWSAAYSTLGVAYGWSIGSALLPFPVSIGVGARHIRGHELQRGRIYEPRVDFGRQDIEIAALALRSTHGTGHAVDVGLAAQPAPWLTLSVAAENVVHRMRWDEELELRVQSFWGRDLSDMGVEDLLDRFESRPFDPASAEPRARTRSRLLRERPFPPHRPSRRRGAVPGHRHRARRDVQRRTGRRRSPRRVAAVRRRRRGAAAPDPSVPYRARRLRDLSRGRGRRDRRDRDRPRVAQPHGRGHPEHRARR